jgi:X-X-X-Leu-X-X-Gly heptad repeat protein
MRKTFVVAVQAIVVVFLAVALSALPVLAAASTAHLVSDDETVYVLMNSDGSSQKTILMDWLRVEGAGAYDLRDPVPGAQDVRLVEGDGTLVYEGGAAHVTGTSTGIEDIYYRATLGKPLPVDVHVATTVGGKATTYGDLKKQTGDVAITVGLTNREKQGSVYVPWTCSLTFTLDNADARSIEAGADGVTAVTGGRTIVTYVIVLDASANISFHYAALHGTDPNLQLAIRPSMPDFPLPSASSLRPLADGLGQIALAFDGQRAILDGVIKGLNSQMVPTFDITQLDRLNDLVTLLKADEAVLRGLYASIDTTQLEPLSTLAGSVTQLQTAVGGITQGIGQLAGALTVQTQLVDKALDLNTSMEQAMVGLPAEAAGTLTPLVLAQRSLLETVAHGGTVQGVPAPVPGLGTIVESLTKLQVGLQEVSGGFDKLAEGLGQLPRLATGMTTLRTTIGTVLDGGSLAGQTLPPFATASNAIAQVPAAVRSQVETLTAKSKQSITELTQTLTLLRDGGAIAGHTLPSLAKLRQGVLSMKNGIGGFATTIQDQVDLMAAKKALALKWTSFGGRPAGAAGSVMFVFTMAQ